MGIRVIAVIVVVLAIIGGGFAVLHKSSPKPAPSSSIIHPPNETTTATSFTINANDETADLTTLNVKKGDNISVKFNVDENDVYHGGLEFKSDVVNSQPIKPGASDTVTFAADRSFDFTPYWYQSDVKKDYLIHVVVE